MTETRRHRALTAARVRMRSPSPRPLLDEARIDDVCAELLALQHILDGMQFDASAYLERLASGSEQPP